MGPIVRTEHFWPLLCVALVAPGTAFTPTRYAAVVRPSFTNIQLKNVETFNENRCLHPPRTCRSQEGRMMTVEGQAVKGTRLFSSSLEKIDAVLNPSNDLLSKAYQRGSYLFLTLASILFLIPDRTITVQLAAKFGGACGYAMAGGLSHILAGATSKDRLSSDTYLRLNLGLLGFSAIGILFFPAEAGFFFRPAPAAFLSLILTMAKAFGVLLSFLGWRRGVDPAGIGSADTLVQELKKGTIQTVKGLRVENAKRALTYRNCLFLVGLGIFSNLMEGSFNFRHREALQRSWFEVSLNGSATARLFMVGAMIFTLKDAAERDRLTGTTFIQLNIMLGVWALLVSMGQSIYPLGIAFHRGVEMLAFSFPFLTKALKSTFQKQQKTKLKRLEAVPEVDEEVSSEIDEEAAPEADEDTPDVQENK